MVSQLITSDLKNSKSIHYDILKNIGFYLIYRPTILTILTGGVIVNA